MGQPTGHTYDDPYGNPLVWVSVGGRRQTKNWPQISVVNLTLVVTAYRKDCKRPPPNFRHCGDRSKCVLKNYFCDRHINCAGDVIPADEEGCVYAGGPGGLEHTTLSPGVRPRPGGAGAGANTVTVVVTAVTAVFWMLVVGVCIAIRYAQGCKCLQARSARRSAQDCPDEPRDAVGNVSRESYSRSAVFDEFFPGSSFGLVVRTTLFRCYSAQSSTVCSSFQPSGSPPSLYLEGGVEQLIRFRSYSAITTDHFYLDCYQLSMSYVLYNRLR